MIAQIVVLRGILCHPRPSLQALRIRIALYRCRKHTKQLRVHDQQTFLLVIGHVRVVLGEAIQQCLIHTRCQGPCAEISSRSLSCQPAHQGM
ncbi:hypothetical protein PFLmoz3_06052 [Pseudomonas fluorescens]|uniref:Uncharacterized protein n=1 Tax=Pseudomonas fluorescens TaxID=294 RepID=A0A125QFR2_PSEFL|nr:hypothetical protein PFLmoz3_06052 [Pseudomonas fluorescens]